MAGLRRWSHVYTQDAGIDERREAVYRASSGIVMLKVPCLRVVPLLAVSMVLVALVIPAGPARLSAQETGANVCSASGSDSAQHESERTCEHESERWIFQGWFAGGTHEPIKTREGHKEDRALYLAGIQASVSIARGRFWDIRYTPALVPGIIATANRAYTTVTYADGRSGLLPSKKTAFGAGLLPVAIEATIAAFPRAGLVAGGGGGAAYFDRRIPDPDETRFNFLANGHVGLYLRSGAVTTTLGFWLQHISNGNRGKVNPGMDSRMLYVGVSR
ncbi:MAG: acyloxyacyl hydrolase [Gemmatimonadota bacterium]|nr:acyloxyacyl hydrolase [Gemmatimonadota bacterium]